MSNKVWTWFKKAAHYIGLGINDANKFLQTSGALNLISLFPVGGAIAGGIGIFEKGLVAASDAEKAAAIFAPGVSGTGPQKLLMAAPAVEQALAEFADTAGFKVMDQTKLKTIAGVIAGAGGDLWNILEPKSGDGLPTPQPQPAPVASASAPLPTAKSAS